VTVRLFMANSFGCFSNNRQRLAKFLEHDPEKWIPVFRKDHAQTTA
jgi:hypothetical protein